MLRAPEGGLPGYTALGAACCWNGLRPDSA
jgi:hypothetical protein